MNNGRIATILTVVWLAIFMLVSCQPASPAASSQGTSAPNPRPRVEGGLPSTVTRFYDVEAGAVCWVYREYDWINSVAYSGMSCLPVGETNILNGQ